MEEVCKGLRQYLRYGHHECIATTVNDKGEFNAAPMGIELLGDLIALKPYVSTRTYLNILIVGEVVLNITSDSILYYNTLFKPERIRYGSSKYVRPPRILGAVDLYVETTVSNVKEHDDGSASVLLRPICCYGGRGSKLAFSRANSLLIEALTHYTKLIPLINEGRLEEVKRRYNGIRAAYEVILRVGNEELREVIKEVLLRSLNVVEGVGIDLPTT